MAEDNAYGRDNRARLGKYPATEPSYVSLLSGQGVPADWENPDYPPHIYGIVNESPEGVGIGGCSQPVHNEEAHYYGSRGSQRHFSQPPHMQASAPQQSRGRGTNFSELEDIWLCNAWVSVSTDPTTGNYQGRGTYWGRITEEYNKLKDANHPFRNEKSLTQRWSLHINPDCSRFAACVASIERRHPSGMNASNIVSCFCLTVRSFLLIKVLTFVCLSICCSTARLAPYLQILQLVLLIQRRRDSFSSMPTTF